MAPTWVWSLVAVAGTATAAVVVFKYMRRRAQNDQEIEASLTGETQASEDVEYEWLSSQDEDETEEVDAEQQQLQFLAIDRARNLLLAMFGFLLMVVVSIVSLVVTWNNSDYDESLSLVELPLFEPFVWIAVGIITAVGTELIMRSKRVSTYVPMVEEKAVFPHDARDFELTRQRDDEGMYRASGKHIYVDSTRSDRRVTNGDDEDKDSVPEDTKAILERADELFEQKEHARTREYLNTELQEYPSCVEMLWRLARACNCLIDEETSTDEKRVLAFEGLAAAEKAYALDSDLAASNKWMAIMTSTVGGFCDLKERIAGAYVIRDHIERAIELDPTDATSHNILGQWCLAFADMTWIEKRVATALFSTPPTATYEEAAQHFQAAESISPGFWKKNVLLLAQTYLKMQRTKETEQWLRRAETVPVKTKEDEEVARDIAKLMKQLKLQ
uniref:Regulator of microtubule dynamics protein 1 n=1 Tax=Peronospora matthiolae TaxID=2874970 RepID=A0AAV1UHN3_9STRA